MDKARKKRIKKYISWIALAGVVLLLTAMPLLARSEADEDGPKATVHSGTVTTGDISLELRGGGTIAAEKARDVTLAEGVKITGFLVKNGDMVKEGDPLATVDTVSVMTTILEVNETLEYLREEMADAQDEKVDSTVCATAGGRVKQVFARKGDRVEDVMLEHGCLAVLSLDGLMAVELQNVLPLATGETVFVTLSDGRELEGRVESNLDGTIVITVEDEGYAIGENVIVTTRSGALVGSGGLYVHNAWKATGYAGTVSAVSAKAESKVSAGSTLFTLTDTDFRGDLEYLSGLHREYEELLQELFALYQEGIIKAPCDGEISGVEEDSEFLLAAIDGERGWFVDLLSNEPVADKGWTVILLGMEEEIPCTGKTGCEAKEHNPGCPEICLVGETCQATIRHEPGCIRLCDGTAACPGLVHHTTCVSLCSDNGDCTALSHRETCPWHTVTYSAYAGKVFAAGTDSLVLYMDAVTRYEVEAKESGWALANPEALKTELMITETVYTVPDGSGYSAGDIVLLVSGIGTDGTVLYQDIVLHRKGQGTGSLPDMGGMSGFGDLAGLLGGMGGGYSGAASAESQVELFDLEGDVLLTVTPRETATVTISLDQQDIARVSLGDAAQVKIHALRGQSVEARVSKISRSGTSSGGSSKFEVELTLPMTAQMVSGMSAAVSIPLSTKMGVPTIPVEALVEEGPETLVYTALDEKTGAPAVPVKVTLGISDGKTVELLSGLAAGDTFYYSYYDILELSDAVEEEGFSFGG